MRESFEDFMKMNYKKYMAYCISKGQNAADADEIVSEAFIRFNKKWSERCVYDEQQNSKWIYNAIEYIIKEYARKNEKHEDENIDNYAEFLPDHKEIDEDLR